MARTKTKVEVIGSVVSPVTTLPQAIQAFEHELEEGVKSVDGQLSPSGMGTYRPGRPSKNVSKAPEIKESFFRAFQKAGGMERLVKLIGEQKLGSSPTTAKRKKAEEADRKFLEFCYKVLPQLFPKRTELEVETRSVKFVFAGGKVLTSEERITKEEDVVDIQFEKEN
jgi:hypothetical protein